MEVVFQSRAGQCQHPLFLQAGHGFGCTFSLAYAFPHWPMAGSSSLAYLLPQQRCRAGNGRTRSRRQAATGWAGWAASPRGRGCPAPAAWRACPCQRSCRAWAPALPAHPRRAAAPLLQLAILMVPWSAGMCADSSSARRELVSLDWPASGVSCALCAALIGSSQASRVLGCLTSLR